MGLLDKIKDNNTQSEGIKVFMGINNFVVEAINPTEEQLKAMGYNPKQEPVYTGEKEGKSTLRLDIYLKNPVSEYVSGGKTITEEVKTKFALFIEATEIVSSTGKKQYINAYGKTSYADSPEATPDWFDKEGIRVCHKGEEELINFLYKWLGLTQKFKDKPGDVCMMETSWDKLVNGNVKELQELVKGAKNNGIKFLLGAKEVTKDDGKVVYYQDVYSKYPMKPGQFSFTGLTEQLNDEYGHFKAHYPSDFKFQLFVPGLIKPDMEKEFAVPSATNGIATTDDLPF